jgi:hypothetical protein
VIDDEVTAFDVANRSAVQLVHAYWIGEAPYQRPPLYDLILHEWLRITGGDLRLLRVPSIPFYVMGLWFLARAGARLGGPPAFRNLLFIGLLWPYGFHFGRLAIWYSCSFFLVALVTYEYLRLQEQGTLSRWTMLAGASLALVYVSYFGWAILACLAFDMILEKRGSLLGQWPAWAGTVIFLLAAYAPFWRSLIDEARYGPGWNHSLVGTLAYTGFTGYVLFVSESVAPWFWWLSVPALVAIAACLGAVALHGTGRARRLFFYFIVLVVAIAPFGP